MIELEVPGADRLRLRNLVLDYNGTLALDGRLLEGVAPRLRALAGRLRVSVVTADTFGCARRELEGLPCEVVLIAPGKEDAAKTAHVRDLGAGETVAVGNGRNDRGMLGEAALGIAVIQEEGAAVEAVNAADVVASDIHAALSLLEHPLRLVATLRS